MILLIMPHTYLHAYDTRKKKENEEIEWVLFAQEEEEVIHRLAYKVMYTQNFL